MSGRLVEPAAPNTSAPDPAQLLARAAELMSIARAIEGTDLQRASWLAGPQTWIGSGPRQCEADVASACRELAQAAGDLRRHASLLNHEAAALTLVRVTPAGLHCSAG